MSQEFIRTARPKYLPDSPALNPSSRRHLITPKGASTSVPRSRPPPSMPNRPANLDIPASERAAKGDADLIGEASPIDGGTNGGQFSDDPYGQLADLEFINGSAGGGYQTDQPRPRGANEDLLF